MAFLLGLWLPIVVTAVVLFFASFVAWMILPHHFGDRSKLDKENEFMDHLRDLNVQPGNYLFPYAASGKEMGSQEHQKRYAKGPRGTINIYSMPNTGANLFCTLLFFLVTATIIGYVAWEALEGWDPAKVTFLKVFQIVGAVGVLTYSSAGILNGIWFKKKLVTDIVDGIVYGIITGLIFGSFHQLGWAVVGS